jgi:hypothetical protein
MDSFELGTLLKVTVSYRMALQSAALFSSGAMITGLTTVLSSFPAVPVYLSEQGEAAARAFGGVLTPFLLKPCIGSATIFFRAIL